MPSAHRYTKSTPDKSRSANACCSAFQVSVSLVIVEADSPFVLPRNCPRAGTKSPDESPCRYSSGSTSPIFGVLRAHDRRAEPLSLTGIRVDPLVVDPRCRHVHRAGARGHGPRLVAAIAHHQPMTILVTNVSELGDVSVNLRLQGFGQHPPRTLPDELVDYRRRSRRRRSRTVAVSRIRNYSEHRVVPSRPALSRRSCLEPSFGHPGRYALPRPIHRFQALLLGDPQTPLASSGAEGVPPRGGDIGNQQHV
jgi:hypothetical protein